MKNQIEKSLRPFTVRRLRTQLCVLALAGSFCVSGRAAVQVLSPVKPPPQSIPATATLPPTPTNLTFTLSGQNPLLIDSVQDGKGVAIRESLPSDGSSGRSAAPQAGQPDIGQRTLDVLLPYDANPATLGLMIDVNGDVPMETSLGNYSVRPVSAGKSFDITTGITQTATPAGVHLDSQGRDTSIYGQNRFWPDLPIQIERTSRLRQYQYVRLLFSPFAWNPVTGELRELSNVKVTLSWQRKAIDVNVAKFQLSDPGVLEGINNRFVNGTQLAPWYLLGGGFLRNRQIDYAIITTSDITKNSTQLGAFISWKQSQGYSVGTFTVESIVAAYPASERADSIRSFLMNNYSARGILYVLLIGNPDPYDKYVGSGDTVGSVPMKMAWPRGDGWASKSDGEACPTDHYFGDLSGSWDVDGDGYAASYYDDYTVRYSTVDCGPVDYTFSYKEYGMDFDMEVYVGRIPFDTISSIDTCLSAAVNYQSTDLTKDPDLASRRQRVLFGMSNFSDYQDSSYLGHQLQFEVTSDAGLTTITMYEPSAYYAGSIELENSALINYWSAKSAGLVVWTGHGNKTESYIRHDSTFLMDTGDVPSLKHAPRAFVLMASCQNGWPESSANLAHTMLLNAAIGTVAGTRNSWYKDGQTTFGDDCYMTDVMWHVAKNLVANHTASYSIGAMRNGCNPNSATDFQDLLTYNLNGEPTARYNFD